MLSTNLMDCTASGPKLHCGFKTMLPILFCVFGHYKSPCKPFQHPRSSQYLLSSRAATAHFPQGNRGDATTISAYFTCGNHYYDGVEAEDEAYPQPLNRKYA
jgi:hypothetical protein